MTPPPFPVRGERIRRPRRHDPGLTVCHCVPGPGEHPRQVRDDFFTNNRTGQYVFQPNQLSTAHEWCQNGARRALRRRETPVIVDNTNTEAWEMLPYVRMAVEHDYWVEIAEPTTPWRHDTKLLAKKSVHGVPEVNIWRMKDRFQGPDVVNVESLHR